MIITINFDEIEDKRSVEIKVDNAKGIDANDFIFAVAQLFVSTCTLAKIDMVELATELNKETEENILGLGKEEENPI